MRAFRPEILLDMVCHKLPLGTIHLLLFLHKRFTLGTGATMPSMVP